MIKTKSPVAREPQFLPKICLVSAAAMTQRAEELEGGGRSGQEGVKSGQ
jgi:hypothetical protein